MGNNNIVRFFHNKYVFLAVNGILFLAAVVSLFVFGTVYKAFALQISSTLDIAGIAKITVMPSITDFFGRNIFVGITLVSVYVIIAVCAAAGIFLTVKAFMTNNSETSIIYICGGTLMFTMIHMISAHISSLILIISLVNEKIGISYIVSYFPVFEVIFMTVGFIIIILYAVLKNIPKFSF